jgi:hypothetical protein
MEHPEDAPFVPQRHTALGADAAPGMQALDESVVNRLLDLERELLLETSSRRAMAATLPGLCAQATAHLAEHLAWLLEREPDALTALSLYRAVLATHPMDWTIWAWKDQVLRTTPFPLLRSALLADLLAKAELDLESEDGQALLALLDMGDPEHRAQVAEHRWMVSDPSKCNVSDLVAMLQPSASMPEKLAAVRVMHFMNEPDLDAQGVPALRALFRVEQHPGLSLRLAETIVKKHGYKVNLELLAFLIRARLGDGVAAAEQALGSHLFGSEGYLLDNFTCLGEERSVHLATALLARFSASHLPESASAVAQALTDISVDIGSPLAAFAATAALQEARLPSAAAGAELVRSAARASPDPVTRALAIRVLGQQPRALLPILDDLKALAVASDTDPRVRRSAFHALVNRHQSALPTKMREVIDLWFQYLREAPFEHFADAMHGSDVAKESAHFVAQFSASFEAIASESARQAAFQLIQEPFGFGIATEFEAHWDGVVALMLRALDRARHEQLHYFIFWNLLHGVPMPARASNIFATGLKARLERMKYPKRSRQLIEGWLADQG